jgi:hypothetical protein
MTDAEKADALGAMVKILMAKLVAVERALALKGINLSALLAEAQAHQQSSAAIGGDAGLRNVHQLSTQEERNAAQPVRGSGWQKEAGFPDKRREWELVDSIVAYQVGGPNSPVK